MTAINKKKKQKPRSIIVKPQFLTLMIRRQRLQALNRNRKHFKRSLMFPGSVLREQRDVEVCVVKEEGSLNRHRIFVGLV